MFVFVLAVRHLIADHREVYLLALCSALIWALWLVKASLSRRYAPVGAEHDARTSVVIPVVDEPPELFREVLARIAAQDPGEVIVVINGARNPGLEQVCEEFAPAVRWIHTPIAGKRGAVRIGSIASKGEITVLVDSDTMWTEDTLRELVKPFADDRVGGVTARQRILDPGRSWIARWADWQENASALYAMPAESVIGRVSCLPGRTIAVRRSILMAAMTAFVGRRFLGVLLEEGDDRTLTSLTLRAGYRTVYQNTSVVFTRAPTRLGPLCRQHLRGARGAQYNTLRMLPWMVRHAPLLAMFLLVDMLVPFLVIGAGLGVAYRAATGGGAGYGTALERGVGGVGWAWAIGLLLLAAVLSMTVRHLRHLREKPGDFLRLPAFIAASTVVGMPIRLLGFVRMAHVAGWGTRRGAYTPDADLIAELEAIADREAPLDIVDRPQPLRGRPLFGDVAVTRTKTPTAKARARSRRALRAPRRRRPNLLAAVPYAAAVAVLALEAFWYV